MQQLVISIHAPTKGATLISKGFFAFCTYFNPRSHEGSDLPDKELMQKLIISIHAPTKGATIFFALLNPSTLISIHAPTKGATSYCVLCCVFFSFQSTLPRRERHYVTYNYLPAGAFQSTLPRRERLCM